MTQSQEIKIFVSTEEAITKSYTDLVEALHLNKISVSNVHNSSEVLRFIDGKLSMHDEKNSFFLDWANDYVRHYKKKYKPSSEPLAKSLKIKGAAGRVVDCTMGTGKDSILLLSFGAKVVAFERQVDVFSICVDAYRRACDDELVGKYFVERLEIKFGEAHKDYQGDIGFAYYDPMYPEKKKKALPRKEMQVFKKVVGADVDIDKVFLSLLDKFENVVVKRPAREAPIKEGCVSFTGKTTRYDRY